MLIHVGIVRVFLASYVLEDVFARLDATHDRHVNVHQDNIKVILLLRVHNLISVVSVFSCFYLEMLLERHFVRQQQEALIIHEQGPRFRPMIFICKISKDRQILIFLRTAVRPFHDISHDSFTWMGLLLFIETAHHLKLDSKCSAFVELRVDTYFASHLLNYHFTD